MSEAQSLTKYQHWLETVLARAVLLSHADTLLVLTEGETDKLTLCDAIESLARDSMFDSVEFRYPIRGEVEKNPALPEDAGFLDDSKRFHARSSVLDVAETASSTREEIIQTAESAQASATAIRNLLCIVDADEELHSGIVKPLSNVVYLDAAEDTNESVPDLETMIFRIALSDDDSPGTRALSSYTREPVNVVVALREAATYIASHARAIKVVKNQESAGRFRLNTSVPIIPKDPALPKHWFNNILRSSSNPLDLPWFKKEEYDRYFMDAFLKANRESIRDEGERQRVLELVVQEARRQVLEVGSTWRLCHGHTLERLFVVVLEQCGRTSSPKELKSILQDWLYASDWSSVSLFRRIRYFFDSAQFADSRITDLA